MLRSAAGMELLPMTNVTFPVAVPDPMPEIVAVKVTLWPALDGLGALATVRVLVATVTASEPGTNGVKS